MSVSRVFFFLSLSLLGAHYACGQQGATKAAQPSAASVVDAAHYDSLQAAADALPAGGGILHIPPGEYELTAPLRIKTGETTIQGVGAATHLINKNESGQPAILIENPKFSGKVTPGAERLWRVRVADLRVTGNPRSGSGIQANYIEEIFIQGVSSSQHGGHGLFLHFCYEDPRVSDNLFTYNKDCGLMLEGCHDIVVSANHFEENQTGLRCIDGYNLTMNGNNLDDHLGDGIVVENTYGSVLSGNMIEECQGWAIILDRNVYGTTVSANVIAHDFSGGIDLRDAHGCAVSGNTFTLVKNLGLAVREKSGGITISGNNFCDSWVGKEDGQERTIRPAKATAAEPTPNEAAGILLEACEAVVISGNMFSRLSSEAVTRQGDCRNIIEQGNGVHLRD